MQQLTDVPARPPPLGMRGLVRRCFDYLGPAFLMTDGEFVLTAGLDGLVSTATAWALVCCEQRCALPLPRCTRAPHPAWSAPSRFPCLDHDAFSSAELPDPDPGGGAVLRRQ